MKNIMMCFLMLLHTTAFAADEATESVSDEVLALAPNPGDRVCGVFLESKIKNEDIESQKKAFEEKIVLKEMFFLFEFKQLTWSVLRHTYAN